MLGDRGKNYFWEQYRGLFIVKEIIHDSKQYNSKKIVNFPRGNCTFSYITKHK